MGRCAGLLIALAVFTPSTSSAQQVDQDFIIGAMRGELAAQQAQGSRAPSSIISIIAGVAGAYFTNDASPDERDTHHGLILGVGFGFTAIGLDGAGFQSGVSRDRLAQVEDRYRDGFAHGYLRQRTADRRTTVGVSGLLFIGAYVVTTFLLDDAVEAP